MVAIDLVPIGRLEERIDTLTFRNQAFVKILKTLRERTFSLGVDIIIRSIDFNLQEDSKTAPPLQFYGYATLVFQDCLSVEIPIRFPRQRIYFDRQWEALRQWRQWVEFYQEYQLHRENDRSLASIMGALSVPYEEFLPEIKENEWIELPLREVLFKGVKNCQFELEFSRWIPISFVDPLTGLTIDGTSNQLDGDKDDGLPKEGIQPKRNPSSSPFSGNPPVTSGIIAGQKGFGIESTAGLSEIDYLPGYEPDSWGYFLELILEARFATFPNSCDMFRYVTYYLVGSNITGATVTDISTAENCAGFPPLRFGTFRLSDGSILRDNQPYSIFISANVIRSPSMPAGFEFRL